MFIYLFVSKNCHQDDIDALTKTSATAVRLRSLQRQTEQRFLLAVEDQKSIGVDVDIAAPRIVAPRSCRQSDSNEFVAAVLNLGRVRLKSRPAHKAKRKRGEKLKLSESSVDEVVERDEYYDWFDVSVDELNCAIAHSVDAVDRDGESLFEPIAFRAQLAVCKIRSATVSSNVLNNISFYLLLYVFVC